MIFLVFISALLAFSLLLASTVFIVWTLRNEGNGIVLAKVVGITVFFLSLLSILAILCFKVKYWKQGYFETPMVMSMVSHKKDMAQMREKMIKRLEQIKKMRQQNLERKKETEKAPASEPSQEGKKGTVNPS